MSSIAQKNYSVQGIVIHRRNFLEADRILKIFTKEKGIISCTVRGARKSTSKLAGSSELFVFGTFYLAKGKKLDVLTGGKPKTFFLKNPKDLSKISDFFLISEVIAKMMPGSVPNPKLFHEMLRAFEVLDSKKSTGAAYEFIYKTFTILGYGLILEYCAGCSRALSKQDEIYLDFTAGGVLCKECAKYKGNQISENCYKLLKYISIHDINKYSLVQLDENLLKELSKTVNDYLNFIYQKEMNSAVFSRHIRELQKKPGSGTI